MRDERGEGRGRKDRGTKEPSKLEHGIDSLKNLEQIEALLFQSTMGLHFMFENADIAKILSKPTDDAKFFTEENMKKVQSLLSGMLDCPSMPEKRSYLERLANDDFEVLVRAYFQLVDKTILAHSKVRH